MSRRYGASGSCCRGLRCRYGFRALVSRVLGLGFSYLYMFMYICIYMYIYICMYYTYIHTYIRIYIYTCTYIHTYIHPHAHYWTRLSRVSKTGESPYDWGFRVFRALGFEGLAFRVIQRSRSFTTSTSDRRLWSRQRT